jgi:DNA-binding SARP family transcriptional activator
VQVEIGVLGTLNASVGDESFVPSASKPRQLLAMFALNAGKVVTIAALMEELWGVRLPRSSSTTLHTYIASLRRRIDPVLVGTARSAKDVLVTEHTGYRLEADPADVDAIRYGHLSSVGRRAVDAGDWATAVSSLRLALDLWRGQALSDVATGSQLTVEVLRLEENRLSDLDLLIEAELCLGRHRYILSELAALCTQHPMLENFHAHYMLALYRSGHQCRALEVFRRLWSTMMVELGVNPSPRIRNLHQAILRGDPLLDNLDPSDGRVISALA